MRATVAFLASIGLFFATVALLLVAPGVGFWVGLALPLGIVALAVVRLLLVAPVIVPILAALTLWAFSAPGTYLLVAVAATVEWAFLGMQFTVAGAGFSAAGFAYQANGLPPQGATYYRNGWYTWSG